MKSNRRCGSDWNFTEGVNLGRIRYKVQIRLETDRRRCTKRRHTGAGLDMHTGGTCMVYMVPAPVHTFRIPAPWRGAIHD